MHIHLSSAFDKKFCKLSRMQKALVLDTLDAFEEHPHDVAFRNHALSGNKAGRRSISADNDLRLVFTVKGNYAKVVFHDVGTHGEVY